MHMNLEVNELLSVSGSMLFVHSHSHTYFTNFAFNIVRICYLQALSYVNIYRVLSAQPHEYLRILFQENDEIK